MVLTNVKQFASELKLSPERLLEQLKNAGVSKRSLEDTLREQDKKQLLDYLKSSHGARDEGKVTLTRKQTSEIHTAAGSTVKVETRKKRTFVRPEDQPAAAADAKAEAPKQEAPKVEEKKPEAKPAVEAAAAVAPVKQPTLTRPAPTSILSQEEVDARAAEERRQAEFRARQQALLREKQEREARRLAAKAEAAAPAP